jgi:hypothetical protein
MIGSMTKPLTSLMMAPLIVELLFDADEEAEKASAFGLKQTEEAIERQMQRSR